MPDSAEGLDDHDKVGLAEDTGIYGHVLIGGHRTQSDMAHMRTPRELWQEPKPRSSVGAVIHRV
jgi:hypothetical protein